MARRAMQPINPAEVDSGKVHRPSSAGAKVTVACKIGVAYFDLQLCEPRKIMENTQTGQREITQWFKQPKVVRIRGTAYPRGTPPTGFPERPEMIGGYALTRNVDKDFWDTWVEQQRLSPYVRNEMIMAWENDDMVRGAAAERADQMSGLEPINPKKDSRITKPTNSAISEITEGQKP